jgi:hypothetical protein
MCTVTFIPRPNGYSLAMNRDEKRTRLEALPPVRRNKEGRTVVYPSEPGGGTWIALNDSGACLALINWYSVTARVESGVISRGQLVSSVTAAGARERVDVGLTDLPLDRINPFRLIGVFRASRDVVEWRWDLKELVRRQHRWRAQQWISSGFDEPTAQQIRGKTFRLSQDKKSSGNLPWLRRLHRSHLPEPGPFSTCMHRADASTVSYTEITVLQRQATMRYRPGPPCQAVHGPTLSVLTL